MAHKHISPSDGNLMVLDYIITHLEEKLYQPSFREIADRFGWLSKNSVRKHIEALEKFGYVERTGEPRAIKILKIPDYENHEGN